MSLPDIYFEPSWGKLYAIKDNGIHDTFLLESVNGTVYYSFVKRAINVRVDGITYFDIITPYGFSGPIVLKESKDTKQLLLEEFKRVFDTYCDENKIITDSCRFNPWLNNHADFSHMYELVPNHSTFGIDLAVDNIFLNELSTKKRNMVRKARKLGVTIHFDCDGSFIEDFLSIYEKTIIKNNIPDYYRFSKEFLLDNFQKLKDKIFIAYAKYMKNIISIAIFLKSDQYIHYHLAANNPEFKWIPGNDALIYDVAEFGKSNGFRYFMLGGAGQNHSLRLHKMGFTKKTEFIFYKGRRICNPEIYQNILSNCHKIDKSFFPSYR